MFKIFKLKPLFYVKFFIVLVVCAGFLFYFFNRSKAFFSGPQIIVDYPENGQSVSGSYVVLKGKSLNTSILTINDVKVLTDEFGNFQKGLLLAKGYNIIELTAEDKFDRIVNQKLEIAVK